MRSLRTASLVIVLITLCAFKPQDDIAEELETLAAAKHRVVLFSLDPESRHGSDTNTTNVFHGFGILGRAEITDASERKLLLNALAQGTRKHPEGPARCFEPRHALRIDFGDRRIDLTICFECASVTALGLKSGKWFIVSGSPEAVFDQSLQRHGLSKSKRKA